MVVAAEIGSGKTHGYLVLLIHKLGTVSSPPENELTHDALQNQEMIPILCPNVMLCEQAVAMANSLLDQFGKQLVKVAAVCGQKGWPIQQNFILSGMLFPEFDSNAVICFSIDGPFDLN